MTDLLFEPQGSPGAASAPVSKAHAAVPTSRDVQSRAEVGASGSLIARAVSKCERTPGYEDASGKLERIEVNGNGIVLLHLLPSEGELWLSLDGDTLKELRPQLDRSLPILSALQDEGGFERREILAYRPGKRVVVANSAAVIKGYRRRRSVAAAKNHRLAEEACEGSATFRVPRLLEHSPETSSLRFERVTGERLDISATGSESFFAVGCRLRAFQEEGSKTNAVKSLNAFAARDELSVLDRWAEKTLYATGTVAESWQSARDDLGSRVQEPPVSPLVLTHRDLHDRQLSTLDGGVCLLDFDLLCRADSALDPANLLAHLSLRALQRVGGADEASAQLCAQALLDGLDRSDETGFWKRLRFYQATSFLRLALVYGFRPRWAAICGDLIELGRRCIEEMRELS
ncbi:MAG: phosphotransferase [Acidobacteriota bacterium]|nr:phosphotransferase [Acidobacteriota bacterium]